MAKKKAGASHHKTANPVQGSAKSRSTAKKPVRWFLLVCALAIVIGVVISVISAARNNAELSEEQKAQISQDWLGQFVWTWKDEGSASGCRYYGEHEGYQIILRPILSLEPMETQIADEIFSLNSEFELLAFQGEQIYDLKSLYRDGKISKESISTIAKNHSGTEELPPLTDAEKDALEALWKDRCCSLIWDTGEKQKNSARYYGKYSDYEVFLHVEEVPPNCLSYYLYKIGGSSFEMDCSAVFYAYKNGHFFRLRELYSGGLLDEKAIADVAKKHEQMG